MKTSTPAPTHAQFLHVILVAASAAIAGLLFGYDTAVINGALVYLRAEFRLTALETELVATILLLGCAAGAACAGYLSDRYGRRTVLLIAGILFGTSALGAAFPHQLWQLFVARAIGGLAIGSASLIAPLYISEISPAHLRGRLVTLNQLAIVSGILLAFLSNDLLATLPHSNWRWMFGLGAIPAIALCLSLLWIPESPRWLVQRGELERARAILYRMSANEQAVEIAIEEIGHSIRAESRTFRELLGPALRRPLTLAMMLAIIQQITGINTVLYYGAIVFADYAGASARHAVDMNIYIGIINLLFTVISITLIDRLGRRPLLLIGTGGMGICLLCFAALLRWVPTHSMLLLLPLLGYVALFAVGLGSGVWVCMAELLPNPVRGRAMALATAVLWLAVSLVTATFLSLIQLLSASGTFLGYAILCAFSFVYIYSRLPETKNRTLEEIEEVLVRQPVNK
jgi:sugar porter (SP) family MFS transporter